MITINAVMAWLNEHPWAYTLAASAFLLLVAWVANFVTKRVLVRGFERVVAVAFRGRKFEMPEHGVVRRLAHAVPAIVLSAGVGIVPRMPEALVTVVQNVCSAYIVLTLALALSAVLNMVNAVYQRRPDAAARPIKGYLQVVKIAIYAIAAILMIAALIDRSPLILLSGLGAMAAVLMLIFQDTLLSLVASVQISSNDIVRQGDWVEMPQLNADGAVIDIALHTVKVRNWDNTITTIPTKRMITESFKNWRGMQESGGRRIKRAIYLDQNSIRFLEPAECEYLHQVALLEDYLAEKEADIKSWNERLGERAKLPVNTRRVTNIGTFRAYVERYLRNNPRIRQDMTLMVRQLNPSAEGLPLEIYCFTNTTVWTEYESIQSDMFDHLLAVLPEFGLRVFQQPSGLDLQSWSSGNALARAEVRALADSTA